MCGELEKPTVYLTDNIFLGKFSVNAGVRVDIPLKKGVYAQPRLSGRYQLSEDYTRIKIRIPYMKLYFF